MNGSMCGNADFLVFRAMNPVSVKTQGGDKLELQLSPGDSVMDVRQFLFDAPETCYFTCYDLLLHTKDGYVHHLEDYNEVSEVADITFGNCFLEMVAGMPNSFNLVSSFWRWLLIERLLSRRSGPMWQLLGIVLTVGSTFRTN